MKPNLLKWMLFVRSFALLDALLYLSYLFVVQDKTKAIGALIGFLVFAYITLDTDNDINKSRSEL